MTNFTGNPLEKLMRQTPRAAQERTPVAAPKGHPCYGCARYGHGCVAPCYRDLLKLIEDKNERNQENKSHKSHDLY